MRMLIVGDLHLRTRTPQWRREPDFAAVGLGKLVQIVRVSIARGVAFVIQVGDFFDQPDPSHALIAGAIRSLPDSADVGLPVPSWYAVHGQHDLAYHSDTARSRSALRVLEAAGRLNLADDPSVSVGGIDYGLYGAAFGQEPPVPEDAAQFNILVAHAMVGNKPLFPGHELTGPEEYVRRHPGYGLYCLGDYHYPYIVRVGNAWVVNAGAVQRLTADERDRSRRPKVVLFDTESGPEDIYLDVTPEADAFDLAGYEAGKARERSAASFAGMASAMGRKTGGVSFRENLVATFEQLGTPAPVQDRVWQKWEGEGRG